MLPRLLRQLPVVWPICPQRVLALPNSLIRRSLLLAGVAGLGSVPCPFLLLCHLRLSHPLCHLLCLGCQRLQVHLCRDDVGDPQAPGCVAKWPLPKYRLRCWR